MCIMDDAASCVQGVARVYGNYDSYECNAV